jgi:hypothetical protein
VPGPWRAARPSTAPTDAIARELAAFERIDADAWAATQRGDKKAGTNATLFDEADVYTRMLTR